jgi:hypothetical protein
VKINLPQRGLVPDNPLQEQSEQITSAETGVISWPPEMMKRGKVKRGGTDRFRVDHPFFHSSIHPFIHSSNFSVSFRCPFRCHISTHPHESLISWSPDLFVVIIYYSSFKFSHPNLRMMTWIPEGVANGRCFHLADQNAHVLRGTFDSQTLKKLSHVPTIPERPSKKFRNPPDCRTTFNFLLIFFFFDFSVVDANQSQISPIVIFLYTRFTPEWLP